MMQAGPGIGKDDCTIVQSLVLPGTLSSNASSPNLVTQYFVGQHLVAYAPSPDAS